ncbi:MAG: NAD(P)H-binding protein [Pseudomonadota bacterium]
MQQRPILVIGATGKTGRRVVHRLQSAGHAVRPGARGAPIPFDWDQPVSWARALAGCRAAYVTYFPDIAVPGAVEKVAALCEAVRAAGLERLVLLTGRGEQHAQRGEEVVRRSGLDHTIIRAAWFAQNFSEGALHAPLLSGVLPMPGGDVAEPIIDIDDIADVAFAALTEPRHSGALYEVTGPRLMTFAQMAEDLSTAMGRPVRHVPMSFEAFHESLMSSMGKALADIVTQIARETLDGRNAHLADGVTRALGRPPRDFAAFAKSAAQAGAWAQVA